MSTGLTDATADIEDGGGIIDASGVAVVGAVIAAPAPTFLPTVLALGGGVCETTWCLCLRSPTQAGEIEGEMLGVVGGYVAIGLLGMVVEVLVTAQEGLVKGVLGVWTT